MSSISHVEIKEYYTLVKYSIYGEKSTSKELKITIVGSGSTIGIKSRSRRKKVGNVKTPNNRAIMMWNIKRIMSYYSII